jgi:peptidoglycan hydrolase-like protein with peptidoglycan-binding domain
VVGQLITVYRGEAGIPPVNAKEVTAMKKLLATLTLGVMMAVPIVAAAAGAGSTRGGLPPAVDQMLAQDMIQQAQANLKMAGYDPGRVDGVFDEQTASALRKYQSAHGIPVSGLLDEQTRRVMFPGFQEAGEG